MMASLMLRLWSQQPSHQKQVLPEKIVVQKQFYWEKENQLLFSLKLSCWNLKEVRNI